MERKPHPKAAHRTTQALFGAHVVYYGATAAGLHVAHSVAAALVLILLILAAWLGVEHG